MVLASQPITVCLVHSPVGVWSWDRSLHGACVTHEYSVLTHVYTVHSPVTVCAVFSPLSVRSG